MQDFDMYHRKKLVDISSQANATQNYKQYSPKKAANFLGNQKFKVGHKIMTSFICKIYKPDTSDCSSEYLKSAGAKFGKSSRK